MWRHQQSIATSSTEHNTASKTWGRSVKIVDFNFIWRLPWLIDLLGRVRNEIMYVLLWRTVYVPKYYFGVYFVVATQLEK